MLLSVLSYTARLESTTKSPILTHYQESSRGIPLIRSMGLYTDFMSAFYTKSRENCNAYFTYWTANQWVTCCLEIMGAAIVATVSLLGVYMHHNVSLGRGAGVTAVAVVLRSLKLRLQFR